MKVRATQKRVVEVEVFDDDVWEKLRSKLLGQVGIGSDWHIMDHDPEYFSVWDDRGSGHTRKRPVTPALRKAYESIKHIDSMMLLMKD